MFKVEGKLEMRIGVVSDTHSNGLPEQMLKDFKNVDLIIHAGDFCSLNDWEQLAKIKEVKAVWGNMDQEKIRKKFPRRQIFNLEACAIGLFHGEGPPDQLLDVVKREFQNEHVDIVIFGHSHPPLKRTVDGVLYFNPGSPNDRVFAPYPSYGMIEIKQGQIQAKIIKLK